MTIFHQKPLLGQQINWAHPLSKNLVGCWLFNEGSGDKVYDLSGNGNHGTLVGMPAWVPGGLEFNGAGDYINCGHNDSLSVGTNDFTIALFITTTEVDRAVLVGKRELAETGYRFYQYDNDRIEYQVEDGTGLSADLSAADPAALLTNGKRHFVAMSAKRTANVDFYIDNVVSSGDISDKQGDLTNAKDLVIGYNPSPTQYFDGIIECVIMFTEALSGSQIQILRDNPYGLIADPYQIETLGVSDVVVSGDTCWGHVTAVTEDNIRTFVGNWTGTGTIGNSGDTERLELNSGEYMISEVVNTGIKTVTLKQNEYDPTGDDVDMNYRHGADVAACEVASWNNYTVPFASLGYVQVRMASTL